MKEGFFEIIFECNGRDDCCGCNTWDACMKFQACFDETIPCKLWRNVTNFESLFEYENRWREYNEQTVKQ